MDRACRADEGCGFMSCAGVRGTSLRSTLWRLLPSTDSQLHLASRMFPWAHPLCLVLFFLFWIETRRRGVRVLVAFSSNARIQRAADLRAICASNCVSAGGVIWLDCLSCNTPLVRPERFASIQIVDRGASVRPFCHGRRARMSSVLAWERSIEHIELRCSTPYSPGERSLEES